MTSSRVQTMLWNALLGWISSQANSIASRSMPRRVSDQFVQPGAARRAQEALREIFCGRQSTLCAGQHGVVGVVTRPWSRVLRGPRWLRYSVDLSAAEHTGDNSATRALRQRRMRWPPGRSPLHKCSTSLLHSRATLTGSVNLFLPKAF